MIFWLLIFALAATGATAALTSTSNWVSFVVCRLLPVSACAAVAIVLVKLF